ncbi:DedA family protein [Thermoanaerobacterium sp. RBIITD]|uniref:DedA family protein n=1 Tax=Thermoanaerobacterium sp. RBIITD TaxID=1550240 RepID=UPI000BB7706C|nr:DedA family protein [Thermoanaerobacterium sp. RBIITD]SNX53381.1 membrane protein DedA, SNARE-associated domain [Thermoanaerobacterium sp. RBIITD]
MDNTNILFRVIIDYGYLALFVALIIEGTGMPGPVEILFFAAGYLISKGQMNFISVVLIAAFGNVVGNTIAYIIGAKSGRPFIEKYGHILKITAKDLEGMDKWFSKYGGMTNLISRLIGLPRTPAIWASGITHMDFKSFFVYSAMGDLLWSAFWTYVSYLASLQLLKINIIGKEYPWWWYFAMLGGFIIFMYIVWRLFLWMKEKYLT